MRVWNISLLLTTFLLSTNGHLQASELLEEDARARVYFSAAQGDWKKFYKVIMPHLSKVTNPRSPEECPYLDPSKPRAEKEKMVGEVQSLSKEILHLGNLWPEDQPVPPKLVPRFTAAYAFMLMTEPQILWLTEKMFIRLLCEKAITYDDLWPKIAQKMWVKYKYSEEGHCDYEYLKVKCLELRRLIGEFQGTGLMIGRGRTYQGYDPQEFYTLDIDRTCEPDAVGSTSIASHLAYFPDNRFQVVFFEHITLTPLEQEDTLKHFFRMTQSKGILKFFGNKGEKRKIDKEYHAGRLQELLGKLKKVGYQSPNFSINVCPKSNNYYLKIEAEKP